MVDFKAPYSRTNALDFLDKFLPDDFQKHEEEIKLDFKPKFIRSIRKIGEVVSLEDTHIYEIAHESENDPRVSLSKDSFRLLAHFNVRKALIYFISKTSPNYRLSLVTVDLKWESGAKVKREYSNPRRYSFFLGPDARVHTPYDFLIKKGQAKDAKDLLSRFDVEIVTKEFFTKYKGLFEGVSGYLKNDHGFKIFAEKNNIDIDTFSKKLLGQVVFCYFLQRKGWLGAKRGELINKGDKDFMRSLFDRCEDEKNFYNDYLEHLFYGSLNTRAEGSGDFYRKHLDCQIPFLNGGLFEPPEDYDWEKSFVHIPDKIFSNKENSGILDVFDLYNFTVYEDDPIDREVSVDPEMLGKVFENLLPENLRKGQGAYYTPREIVHYMCQESLINYLVTETKVDADRIRDLVVNKLFDEARSRESIDRALQNIKVCDPACGSGAFLVGMLHEIVSARHTLNTKDTEYNLKKEAIQNSIYGVDIDPGAVDIAKLRLWLSLVVDYELKDIEPLPNLDYKIMCGNSLLEEFEGVRFYNGAADDVSLFKDERKQKIQELRERVKDYFNVSDDKEKRRKRDEINKLKDWFIKTTLEKRRKEITRERKKIEAKADMFQERNRKDYFEKQGEIFVSEAKINEVLRELHNPQKARPFFIWNLEFMDVFEEKGGFDVVIANPPYIDSEGMVKSGQGAMREAILKTYIMTRGNWDIYIAFFELGFRILDEIGGVTFITPDKWISKPFGDELRKNKIGNIYAILKAGREIFESAKVDSIVSFFNKRHSENIKIFNFEDNSIVFKREVGKKILKSPYAFDSLFSYSLDLLTKIESTPNKISNLANCENACATSDAYKIGPLIKELSKERFDIDSQFKIINTGTIDKYVSKWGNKEMTYLGRKYLCPVVNKNDFSKLFKNSYAKKSQLPKIIMKGLNLLDACLDPSGNIIPGKSTLIITSEDENNLKFLLAIMNSRLVFFYLKEKYPASSYNQGTTFTKNMINNLPIPSLSDSIKNSFIESVDKILTITKSEDYTNNPAKQEKINEYERQIDQMVYKLYSLTPDEVRIVEGNHG